MSKLKSQQAIKVWDIFIRVFHWSLVILFTLAYLTGEEETSWHAYFGYAIGILLVLRIIWGFIGTRYARFSTFIYSPSTVIAYLKSLLSGKPKHYLGHNPAGAYMVFALLFMLSMTTFSGLKAYAAEGYGPLAFNMDVTLIAVALADDDDDEKGWGKEGKEDKFWKEIHEFTANLTLFLVFMHILGVIVSSSLHKENLVRAMISGKKYQQND